MLALPVIRSFALTVRVSSDVDFVPVGLSCSETLTGGRLDFLITSWWSVWRCRGCPANAQWPSNVSSLFFSRENPTCLTEFCSQIQHRSKCTTPVRRGLLKVCESDGITEIKQHLFLKNPYNLFVGLQMSWTDTTGRFLHTARHHREKHTPWR